MYACQHCGAPIEDPRAVFRASTCSRCGRDLHSCVNCRFYSPGAHYDCTETIDEEVRDKERSNFCSYFALRQRAAKSADKPDAKGEARRKLGELFGNG